MIHIVWRTDGQTDILPRHSPCYAYASHDKNHLLSNVQHGWGGLLSQTC